MNTNIVIALVAIGLLLSGCKKNSPTESDDNASQATPRGMVSVDGGAFHMGSTTGNPDDQPVHAVTVGSFSIDTCEITFEKWTEVQVWGRAHGYTDLPAGQNGKDPSGIFNPVTMVNWYDVLKWCNARSEMDSLTPAYYTSNTLSEVYRTGSLDLATDAVKWTAAGYRIPTEAEWEFAARGGVKSHNFLYSGSDSLSMVAWYYGDPNEHTTSHRVGTKSANELGIHDMSGNVYELCWDWYGTYTVGAQSDPRGAAEGTARAIRGGSYNAVKISNRVTARFMANPEYRSPYSGFRCVER